MAKAIQMKTSFPGPKSQALMKDKERLVPDAFSIHVPVAIQSARGALVEDVDGNVYIDLAGGLGCLNVGHSAPEVVAAIQEAAARFTHTDFSVIMYDSYVQLAESLCRLAPISGAKKACFFNAGAEAVENAVKFARKFTKRRAIIALEGAFHGRTNLTMALTSKVKPYKEGFGPFAPEIYRVPQPYLYRRPAGMTEEQYIDFCADAFERALLTQVAPSEVAAVIMEPVQGEGGFVPLPRRYVERVQQVCRQHGILIIADEIQTGYGRTGAFFASEVIGLEPDLMTVGKSMAAGLPLSGVIGRKEIMDAPGDSTIGGTYVGNPICCAAANAVMTIMERDNLVARARHLGELYRAGFAALAQELREVGGDVQIGDIRGLGAMVGVEFVKNLETKEPNPAAVSALMGTCMQRGVLTVKCGIYGNVLRMLSPLVITDEQVAEALGVIRAVALELARVPSGVR
jgi:4-aminobutyrate aminotransferase/(S)-3-amino-2-methylpropionate transaminase